MNTTQTSLSCIAQPNIKLVASPSSLSDAIRNAEQAIRQAERLARIEAQRQPNRYRALPGNLAGARDLLVWASRRFVSGSAAL